MNSQSSRSLVRAHGGGPSHVRIERRAEGDSNMRANGIALVLTLGAFLINVGGCSSNDITPVNVTPPDPNVAVSISPKSATVPVGGSMTLGAAITGSTNPGVEWAVFSTAPAFGYVSQTGVYTAPTSITGDSIVVFVEATAKANGEKSDTARIVVMRQ
jgi:hypothetical protein